MYEYTTNYVTEVWIWDTEGIICFRQSDVERFRIEKAKNSFNVLAKIYEDSNAIKIASCANQEDAVRVIKDLISVSPSEEKGSTKRPS